MTNIAGPFDELLIITAMVPYNEIKRAWNTMVETTHHGWIREMVHLLWMNYNVGALPFI